MPLNFNTTYMNNFPPAAQAAFGRALNTWSHALDSPVQVEIWAVWGANLPPHLSACCIPNSVDNFLNAPIGNVWYPSSLADKLAGHDLKGNEPDFTIFFGNENWYTGTGNPPHDQFDLESIALHEMGHGFGFVGTFWATNTWPNTGSYGGPELIALANQVVEDTDQQLGFELPNLNNQPSVYGVHIEDQARVALTGPANYQNNSQALGEALVGYNLSFDSNHAPIYAPNPFLPFTSIDHLNDPNSLMRPCIDPGVRIRAIDAPVTAILAALGW